MLLAHTARLGPIHGYALIGALSADTDGILDFKPGTIYPILNELERSALLKSRWGQGESGPQRKEYSITASGTLLLRHAAERWTLLRDRVDATLRAAGGA